MRFLPILQDSAGSHLPSSVFARTRQRKHCLLLPSIRTTQKMNGKAQSRATLPRNHLLPALALEGVPLQGVASASRPGYPHLKNHIIFSVAILGVDWTNPHCFSDSGTQTIKKLHRVRNSLNPRLPEHLIHALCCLCKWRYNY